MSYVLFTELSNEQQEIVTGGTDIDLQISYTDYLAKENVLTSTTTSGPGGSTATSTGTSLKIDTKAFTLTQLTA